MPILLQIEVRSERDLNWMYLFKKLVVKNIKKRFYDTKLEQKFLLSNKGQVLLSRLLSCLISTLVIRERNVKEADLVV